MEVKGCKGRLKNKTREGRKEKRVLAGGMQTDDETSVKNCFIFKGWIRELKEKTKRLVKKKGHHEEVYSDPGNSKTPRLLYQQGTLLRGNYAFYDFGCNYKSLFAQQKIRSNYTNE